MNCKLLYFISRATYAKPAVSLIADIFPKIIMYTLIYLWLAWDGVADYCVSIVRLKGSKMGSFVVTLQLLFYT